LGLGKGSCYEVSVINKRVARKLSAGMGDGG